ncbi:MAG: tetratricopeptide repeat protein [Promethearchaeota archaeon]
MGKKPSYWKKLSPILKDANDFRDQKLFKESIRKFYEAIDFISLKAKDPEERASEIKKMKSEINQVYCAEISDVIARVTQLIELWEYDNASELINKAILINEKIDDIKLKNIETTTIQKVISEINLRKKLEEGIKLKNNEKFDEALNVFKKALDFSIEINSSETDNEEKANIKSLITQTYSTHINLIIDQGIQLRQDNNYNSAIDTLEKAFNIAEEMDDVEQKREEYRNIEAEINEVLVQQVRPIFNQGKELVEQQKNDEAITTINKALVHVNKMHDSEQKRTELKKLSELINPIYAERIKPLFESGKKLILQEKFEESITTISDATNYFSKALNVAKKMIESEEKDGQVKKITDLIDQTCCAGINVRKEKALHLIEEKKFEDAIGELYSGLSIAKKMACAEEDNYEANSIKKIINTVYSAEIDELIKQGKVLITNKKLEEAIKISKNALSIINKMYLSAEMEKEANKVNYFIDQLKIKKVVAKGDSSVGKEKFEKEINDLKKSLEKANKIQEPNLKKEETGKIKKSIDQIHSSEITLLIEQANLLTEQSKEKEAVELLEQALSIISDREIFILRNEKISNIIESIITIGRHLLTHDKFDDAFEVFERALRMTEKINDKKRKAKEIFNIKEIYKQELNKKAIQDIEVEQYDKAIEYCEKAIKIDSEFAESYYNMGVAYHNENKHDLALKYYEKAVELEYDHLKTWNNMGILYEFKGDYNNALKAYNKAVKIDLLQFLKLNRKNYLKLTKKD